MCGILGYIRLDDKYIPASNELESSIPKLFEKLESRGKDASGLAVVDDLSNVNVYKTPENGKKFVSSTVFHALIKPKFKSAAAVIGQTRLVTNGTLEYQNNQPICLNSLIMVHNGIVVNAEEIRKQSGLNEANGLISDSVVLAEFLEEKFKNTNVTSALSVAFKQIKGSASIAGLLNINSELTLFLATNTGSIYYCVNKGKYCYFASEASALMDLKNNYQAGQVQQVKAGKALIISQSQCREYSLHNEISSNNYKCRVQTFRYAHQKPKTKTNRLSLNAADLLKSHTIDFDFIKKIPRCRNCVLPISTPGINFNEKGVCNYCLQYQPAKYLGKSQLERDLAKYRRNDGKPDCIVALSGGRDSCYGLHYLVKEMGMHPIAFTYDWGMISTLGRRNQARMVGALGVDHVVVAADLQKSRQHIRNNVTAWMKKPDLGMIPLFMQGDKVAEYYIDKLRQQLGIDCVIFFRGNVFEREEFKAGYCGVKNADPGGVIHNLNWTDKLRLLRYYGTQYLSNPRYINSSIWSTLMGYLVTYIQPHDYLYLWHYIPWNEADIVSTLMNTYGWETAQDTVSTWRIDDGSPAFYNYIYCQVQGFTEHDSFRSNQIREGLMSREQALSLVYEENKPRYEALAWYFDAIEMKGHDVLSVVDAIPKTYAEYV